MERPVGRRHEDVDPEVECRQRRRKQPQYEEPPPPFPHPSRFIVARPGKSNPFAHLFAQKPADPIDLRMELTAFGRQLPLLLLGDGVREAREALVQLHALRRDSPLLFPELGKSRSQFGFVHTVSFTSSRPSEST